MSAPPQGFIFNTMQSTLINVIEATTQKLIIPIKAAMDETTYINITKSGNDYVMLSDTIVGDASNHSSIYGEICYSPFTTTTSGAVTIVYVNIYAFASGNARMALYSDSAGAPSIRLNESGSVALADGWNAIPIPSTALTAVTPYWVAVQCDNVTTSVYYESVVSGIAKKQSQAYGAFPVVATPVNNTAEINMRIGIVVAGTIISNAIAKDAGIGLRNWGDICANLIAGAAGSTIAMKICDSAGTPLHSNFVTIPAAEYAEIPLERAVVLTATSGSQTTWNYTSLTGCDAFLNELGVLARAMLVELALDGTSYSKLAQTSSKSPAVGEYFEDISNIKAPQIIINGTGIINTTSKLRTTYIVNIPLANTTIKLQIQLNRLAIGDTSPRISLLVGDATKYVSAGQVAIV